MPRANRYFLLGLVWHITHRLHRKAFLLKFARDREELIELCGFTEAKEFQRAHHQWIEQSLEGELTRAAHWSEAIAVGRPTFVEKVQNELGAKAMYRSVERGEQTSLLREERAPYRGYFACDK